MITGLSIATTKQASQPTTGIPFGRNEQKVFFIFIENNKQPSRDSYTADEVTTTLFMFSQTRPSTTCNMAYNQSNQTPFFHLHTALPFLIGLGRNATVTFLLLLLVCCKRRMVKQNRRTWRRRRGESIKRKVQFNIQNGLDTEVEVFVSIFILYVHSHEHTHTLSTTDCFVCQMKVCFFVRW